MASYLQKMIQELRKKRGIEKPKAGCGIEACSPEECAQFLKMTEDGLELPPHITRRKADGNLFFRKLVQEESAEEPSREEVMEFLEHRKLKELENISRHLDVIKDSVLIAAIIETLAATVYLAWLFVLALKAGTVLQMIIYVIGMCFTFGLNCISIRAFFGKHK